MDRRSLGWLVGLAVALGSLACPVQAGEGEARPGRGSVEVVLPGAPLSDRIAFVVDVSGSMRGQPMRSARAAVGEILRAFPDDGNVRVFACGTRSRAYAEDWVRMPDGAAIQAIEAWLRTFQPSGGTTLETGLADALASPEGDLSVVLVTDGSTSRPAAVLDVVAEAGRTHGARPIHVYGLDPGGRSTSLLRRIARRTGGTFVAERIEGW